MASSAKSIRAMRTDWGLLFVVLVLVLLGLVMVYSASYGFALIKGGTFEGRPTYFIRRQVLFVLAGLVALIVLSRVDYHLYQRYALHILVATVLILLPLVFAKKETGGATRWALQGSVQPAELARLGATVYIAVWLAVKGVKIRDINLGLIPFALLLGFIAGLVVLQPNFSTAVLLVATAAAMFFAAGADMRQLLIGFLFGGVAVALVALAAPYRSERIALWRRGPFSDAYGEGFQIVQSLAALNRGGWFGIGLGQSRQKFAVFAPHTDSIFAITGEEMGFIGLVVIIALYVFWTWRGLRIAARAEDTYGMLLALGIVCWVAFQAILHIAVATATTPATGTVLPFISYGGSSVMSCLASVGILMSISRGSRAARQEQSP